MKAFKGIAPKCRLCGDKFDPIFKPNTAQVQDYTIKQPSFTDIHVGWDYVNHKCNEKGLEKNKIKLQASRIKQQKQASVRQAKAIEKAKKKASEARSKPLVWKTIHVKMNDQYRKPIKIKRKTTGEKDFFESLWNSDKAKVSALTGLPLSDQNDARAHFFAHILPKGKYPKFRLNPDNIMYLELEEHYKWDFERFKCLIDPAWAHIIELENKLKKQYDERL
jgi:hypothetical protein